MILCFSGTGNSKSVANYLSGILGDDLIRLAPGLMCEPEKIKLPVTGTRLIWVFPVHGWGLSTTVRKVIRRMTLLAPANIKHYMVCTCGDDAGYVDREWRKELGRRGWIASSAFSVQMPNSYVALPGFHLDSPELTQKKLDAMPERVEAIAASIEAEDDVTEVVRGSFAWLKTYVIGKLFFRFCMSTSKFYTEPSCTGCGKCARNCPLGCIEIVKGRPKWKGQCNMCLRCYHICPHNALQCGRYTKGKGQYLNPDYSLE